MASDTKESIRQQIWSYLESNDIARFPRPVYNRIPNFEGAEIACNKVRELHEYQNAKVVKINPDSPQKPIRFLTLEDNKILLASTPRLRSGLLNRIIPPENADKHTLQMCATSEGVKKFSVRLDLNKKVKIDLLILGSVAVSLKGQRIGKGRGYADLGFAMMAAVGAVNSETTIVTVVHDCQVLRSIPDNLFKEHDVPVDIIVTPTRILRCEQKLPKPHRIIWPLLSEESIREIPILKKLKKMAINLE
ncbi:methenyltetrahydrofolate synthase domain-containing protein-like isoform X1 [Argiope bruennichi]|uniref:methenyltetrahydrofolate synthase domain-containing protein-like isoform X1 n=1 Tax=Argiope bruennichi TaxID=94029 RepID=UPI0024959A97|nr:methenyltetrahydrofolate synthase domain-containing protein-like isoform X1 [Argiope bruennichi]